MRQSNINSLRTVSLRLEMKTGREDIRALRRLLKALMRRLGLRCVSLTIGAGEAREQR